MTDYEQAYRDALAGHWFRVFNPRAGERLVGCQCGWRQPLNADRNAERHNAHLAEVITEALAPSVPAATSEGADQFSSQGIQHDVDQARVGQLRSDDLGVLASDPGDDSENCRSGECMSHAFPVCGDSSARLERLEWAIRYEDGGIDSAPDRASAERWITLALGAIAAGRISCEPPALMRRTVTTYTPVVGAWGPVREGE